MVWQGWLVNEADLVDEADDANFDPTIHQSWWANKADYAKADTVEVDEVNEAICNSKTIETAMKLKSDTTTNRDIAKGRD